MNSDDFQDFFLLPNLSGRTRWTLTFLDQGLRAGERVVKLSDFATLAKKMHSEFG
jgi:hypothetical protein